MYCHKYIAKCVHAFACVSLSTAHLDPGINEFHRVHWRCGEGREGRRGQKGAGLASSRRGVGRSAATRTASRGGGTGHGFISWRWIHTMYMYKVGKL